ncbi:hypothetical protein LTR09_003634 [Extremus antarcticus]|uniref:AB hydrolase-1 domain-containing protein n=1 Tax=Extremus antarcticus TaxID=702011 RepID=A0AAJ0DKM4_9PEZI|nr:hypothetical protein LTR09_003634 [Extremus antarcticus]
MVQDLIDICDAENIRRVVSIGHDHGSGIAARFYNHAPQRVAGLVMLNVGYQIPEKQQSFDLDTNNDIATRIFGWPILEYWHFLTSPEATRLLNNNLERLWDCAHAGTFEEKKSLYCVPGAMKRYLSDHSIPRISTKPYAHDWGLKQRWMSQFQAGGLAGPLCWYTSRVINAQVLSDKHIPDANIVVKVPTLFIGCDRDTVCRPELINGARDAGLLPDLTIKTMEGVAHWPMYEAPQETAMLIMEFLHEKQL